MAEKKNIPETKIKAYREKNAVLTKQRRSERRREVAEGNTDSRRLAFIDNILKAYGINHKELALKLGCTPQNVYWIFGVTDDCALSRAEQMLAALGLRLQVTLERNNGVQTPQKLNDAQFVSNNVRNRIQGTLPEAMKTTARQLPGYITACPDEARLKFLADYILTLGLPAVTIERNAGMTHGNLFNFFKRDDINISKIFDIVQATGGEIVWNVNPADK